MWLCKLKPAQVWLRWAAFAFAFAAGTFFDYGMIRDPNDEMLWRIAAATGICAGCGTVAVAILTAFNRRMMPVAGAGVDAKEIAVVCPVCHKKQNVAIAEGIGESACAGCGMIISVRLRPPRCPACNYILLMIHSDRCPECGTAIAGALPAVSAS
jgi:ssDNA-binding Zn-finger/Zn-ribbon topoisomerase 1